MVDPSAWHDLEIFIIVVIIIIQVRITFATHSNIQAMKGIFSKMLFLRKGYVSKDKTGQPDVDPSDILFEDEGYDITNNLDHLAENYIKLPLVDTEGTSKSIKGIRDSINTYLINNFGAGVNFSIIKDLVDREVEIKDNTISQTINLPLYLGLAATMLGIIFGLFAMPSFDPSNPTLAIDPLINGVKTAMLGSLVGLVMTICLSAFSYRPARQVVQEQKNKQLSYLQATLLPELIKAEDTGVSGLKSSLDRFAREATKISDTVLIAANQTGENLMLQKEVIEKVDNMNMLKVSKYTLELYDKMEANMDAFSSFSRYLAGMERISGQLAGFAERTSDIDRVIRSIDENFKEAKDLSAFLAMHFDKIERAGGAARDAVGIAELHFESAITELKKRTDELIGKLTLSAGNHDETLNNIYKAIAENLNQITNEYVSAFSTAFSDSMPKLKQLDHLESIKEINASLDVIKQNRNQPIMVHSPKESGTGQSKSANKIGKDSKNETLPLNEVLRKILN